MKQGFVHVETTGIMSGTVRDRFCVIRRYIESGSVLDVGCVGARPARESTAERLERKADLLFRRICEINPEAVGVDIDAEGIEVLRNQGFIVACSDVVTMDLERRFDTIIAGEVIEHMDNVGLLLRNLRRHLEPDGVLIATTPNPFYAGQIWKIWRYGRPRAREDHTAWFDPITLQSALRRAELEPFDGYWVQPRRNLFRTWQRVFRSYFSHSFIILSRPQRGPRS